jgi:mannose-6-phosphate isomerase-like protein (cupin superfamily)
MSLQPGIQRRGDSMDGVHWNIMGQVYSPKSITEDCFSWHALLPPETFVPPHIHPTQDEYIHVLTGELDLVLNGKHVHAITGDLVCLPRGIPHGIFNNTGHEVTALFWVTPTGQLVDLFRKLHNLARPDEVVALARDYAVNFLPPQRAADVMGLK